MTTAQKHNGGMYRYPLKRLQYPINKAEEEAVYFVFLLFLVVEDNYIYGNQSENFEE